MRAGLGRSSCSLLAHSVVCECHTISTMPVSSPRRRYPAFSRHSAGGRYPPNCPVFGCGRLRPLRGDSVEPTAEKQPSEFHASGESVRMRSRSPVELAVPFASSVRPSVLKVRPNSATSSRRSPVSYLATKDCGRLNFTASWLCVTPAFRSYIAAGGSGGVRHSARCSRSDGKQPRRHFRQ